VTLQEILGQLTIGPTTVESVTSLPGIAAAVLMNPGARLIGVVDATERLIGVIPVAAVAEHLLFAAAPQLFDEAIPDLVRAHVYARYLGERLARDLMQQPVFIPRASSVAAALHGMRHAGHDGLPITDERHRVIGYADRLDLLAAWGRIERRS
jgi:CBS domain-containing protein